MSLAAKSKEGRGEAPEQKMSRKCARNAQKSTTTLLIINVVMHKENPVNSIILKS